MTFQMPILATSESPTDHTDDLSNVILQRQCECEVEIQDYVCRLRQAQGEERITLERQLGDLRCAQSLLAFMNGLVEAMNAHEDDTKAACQLNGVRLLGDQLVRELVHHGATQMRAEHQVQSLLAALQVAREEPAGCGF